MKFFPLLFKRIVVAIVDIGRIHQSGTYKLIIKTSNALSVGTLLGPSTALDMRKVIIAATKYEMIRVNTKTLTILADLIVGGISMKLGLIFDKAIITRKVTA